MKPLLLSSLSLFLLLPACGNSGGPAGSWVLDTSAIRKKIEESQKNLAKDPKTAAMAEAMRKQSLAALENMKIRIVLEGSGSFRIAPFKGGSQAKPFLTGTWSLDKDVVTLKPSGKEKGDRTFPTKLRYQGDKLVPITGGNAKNSMIFLRE